MPPKTGSSSQPKATQSLPLQKLPPKGGPTPPREAPSVSALAKAAARSISLEIVSQDGTIPLDPDPAELPGEWAVKGEPLSDDNYRYGKIDAWYHADNSGACEFTWAHAFLGNEEELEVWHDKIIYAKDDVGPAPFAIGKWGTPIINRTGGEDTSKLNSDLWPLTDTEINDPNNEHFGDTSRNELRIQGKRYSKMNELESKSKRLFPPTPEYQNSAHKRRFLEEDEIVVARLTQNGQPVPKQAKGYPWVVQKPYRDQCRDIGINEDFTLPLVTDTCPYRGEGWIKRASQWNVADGYINWKGKGRPPFDLNDPLLQAYHDDNARKGRDSRNALAAMRANQTA